MQDFYPQLIFYVNSLWQRRWVALGLSWVMCAAVWAYVAFIPNTYVSTGRIYVDTKTVLQPLLAGLTIENDVFAELQVMTSTLLSSENLLGVVRKTDLDVTVDTDEEMNALIEGLRTNTSIVTQEGGFYAISHTGPDPVMAQRIVQALIALFVEANIGENRQDMDQAQEFLEQKIREYEVKLEAAEQRRAKFQQENMALLPGRFGYQERLGRAQGRLDQLRSTLEATKTQRDVIRGELATIPASIERYAGQGPPLGSDGAIIQLEAQLEQLLTNYTDKHPQVLAIERRLKTLYSSREQEELMLLNGTDVSAEGGANSNDRYQVPNPLYDLLRSRAVDQEAQVQVLRDQIAEQEIAVAELHSLARSVPLVQAELQKLNRDYGVLQDSYQSLLARRETARISEDREIHSQNVQFRIVDPPQVPFVPSGPQRDLFFLMATLAGLGSGVGTAFLLALLNTTYASGTRLNEAFGVPMAGTIMRASNLQRRALRPVETIGFAALALALPAMLGILLKVEQEVGFGTLTHANALNGDSVAIIRTVSDSGKRVFSQLIGEN